MQKAYKKSFVRQKDQSDCGVACLAALTKFYGGEIQLERLRELSGTDKQGTTMLGIYQAARQTGLEAEAFEADLPNLKELDTPCILHVVMDERLQHYVICYGYENNKFIISDPGKDVSLYTDEELEMIWQSKALLIVKPNSEFKKAASIKDEKWFWVKKLIEDDLNILGIALILGVIVAVLSLATAVFSQKLIDDILPNNQHVKLIVGLSLLLFLLLVKSGVGFIRQSFLIRQSKDFNNRIINHFYGSLLHLPKSFFDNRKTGELVARMNDTMRIQGAVSYLTASLMIDVLLVVITSIFILFYSWVLGLIAMTCIPLYFITVFVFHDKIVSRQRDVMAAYARNESNYVDTMQGIGDIKVMNKENLFSQITKTIYDSFQQKIYALGQVRISFNLTTEVIGTLLIMAIITVSSIMVINENLKVGQMMAVIQMIAMLMPAAGRLAMTNIQLQEARVAFDRMFEFTSIYPEYVLEEDNKKSKIKEFLSLEFKNISFRFPGRSELLKDISFTVKRGEMISLLGESGCGKSTTLQIIQHFYKHEKGSVVINGEDEQNVSTHAWRNLIGVVPQDIKIFNGTLVDNVCLGEKIESPDGLASFFKKFGFDKYFEQFPQSYATIIGEEGINLSGGEKQLVAFARALYKKPELLILDEATSAMDRNTEAFVVDILNELKKDIGIILVTHRVKTARNADRIYILENGVINASGSHSELMEGDNLYALSWKDYLNV